MTDQSELKISVINLLSKLLRSGLTLKTYPITLGNTSRQQGWFGTREMMGMAKAVVVDVVALIDELVEVRKSKAELATRESAIRKSVLDATGNVAVEIADEFGVIVAEVVESVRRSVNDWDEFEVAYPEAYEALVKFTDVLTLNTPKK